MGQRVEKKNGGTQTPKPNQLLYQTSKKITKTNKLS